MATLTARKPLGDMRAQAEHYSLLAAWHNSARNFRALQIREMVEGIEWRTPSGVPFAWIGGNPPRGYDAGATDIRNEVRAVLLSAPMALCALRELDGWTDDELVEHYRVATAEQIAGQIEDGVQS